MSRASLSYAAMKADQHGVSDIEFIQMDILDLPELGRMFDVIRCGGVLHHMDDPLAGWEMLCRCLNPGGLMNIALYSAVAREPLAGFPTEIPDGVDGIDQGIRASRYSFLPELSAQKTRHERPAGAETHSWVPIDYWELSGCRDLLFHAREHRFTLSEIGAALEKLGLEFLGFDLVPHEAAKIEARKSNLVRSVDLAAWDIYERKYPETFKEMYIFWCRKPAG